MEKMATVISCEKNHKFKSRITSAGRNNDAHNYEWIINVKLDEKIETEKYIIRVVRLKFTSMAFEVGRRIKISEINLKPWKMQFWGVGW